MRFLNRKGLVQIFLLGAWAIFQYSRGNELYAVVIILLFVVLSIPRLQNFTLIAVLVLVIILFKTSIMDTWIEIREYNLNTFQTFKPSMSKLFTPDSGRDVLPAPVQQMLSILLEKKITEYRLSNAFEQDPQINQRIIESAWPAKKDSASPYLLCSSEEARDMADCFEVARREEVTLVYCP